jgi:hypothetical protein
VTPTRDQLLDDAIQWMASQVDNARHCASAKVVRPPAIDQHASRAEGRKRLQASTKPKKKALAPLAVAICAKWEQPRAGDLAGAWLDGREVDAEVLMNSDEVAILVGVAAAAAVLAVVLFVRRGRTARVPPSRDLAPSPEFQALCAVASRGPRQDKAARIASRIRNSVAEPWAWTASDGLSELTPDDKRALLDVFAADGVCGVSRIQPGPAAAFDPQRMTTDVRTTEDDHWVVCRDVSAERVGYLLGNRVEVRAHVDVCTVDWWLLSTSRCPVGRAIAERSDELVVGGRGGANAWRARWGLTHPEDLRALFEEPTLDVWRKRMVAELNPHYPNSPERCLSIIGHPGDVFEASIMEAEGSISIGDATVDAVVERQGKAQHGLACPGGSPLLLAIVRAKPVGRGAA